MRLIDITGQRFGRLLVLQKNRDASGNLRWEAQCDCGKVVTVVPGSLRRKVCPTRSCGCLATELLIDRSRKEFRVIDHPLYSTWDKMRQRCYNPKHIGYKYYGGRGICICERWKESFWHFVEDVGERPSTKHTLDRYPDRDGNYGPRNFRWATRKEQMINRDITRLITVDCITDSVKATARRVLVPGGCLRLWMKRGFSAQEIVDQYRSRDWEHSIFPTLILRKNTSPARARQLINDLFDEMERDLPATLKNKTTRPKS